LRTEGRSCHLCYQSTAPSRGARASHFCPRGSSRRNWRSISKRTEWLSGSKFFQVGIQFSEVHDCFAVSDVHLVSDSQTALNRRTADRLDRLAVEHSKIKKIINFIIKDERQKYVQNAFVHVQLALSSISYSVLTRYTISAIFYALNRVDVYLSNECRLY
jgi:hypothetical protein